MDRRTLLRSGGLLTAGVALGGAAYAGLAFCRSQRAASLAGRLSASAGERLAAALQADLRALPERAEDGLRRYMVECSLNVATFIERLCAPAFRASLARLPEPVRPEYVRILFARTVTSEEAITAEVRRIAGELGGQLDSRWRDCCGRISAGWTGLLGTYADAPRLTAEDVEARVTPVVRARLEEAIRRAESLQADAERVWAIGGVGETALLLFRFVPAYGRRVPAFVLEALGAAFRSVVRWLLLRTDRYQTEITTVLSDLGHGLAAAFRGVVREQVEVLYSWRRQAVEESARREASRAVRLL